MEKTQLFYFAKNDLMISVEYDKREHMASYKCHRTMSARETQLIEKYIEIKVLETPNPIIVYFGEDDELQKTWDEFHSIDMDKEKNWKIGKPPEKFDELSKSDLIKKIHNKFSDKKELLANLQSFLLDGISQKMVTELKAGADEGFCFDKIGDILRDRNENHPEEPNHRMEELKMYLKEYNQLSNKSITIKSLI